MNKFSLKKSILKSLNDVLIRAYFGQEITCMRKARRKCVGYLKQIAELVKENEAKQLFIFEQRVDLAKLDAKKDIIDFKNNLFCLLEDFKNKQKTKDDIFDLVLNFTLKMINCENK